MTKLTGTMSWLSLSLSLSLSLLLCTGTVTATVSTMGNNSGTGDRHPSLRPFLSPPPPSRQEDLRMKEAMGLLISWGVPEERFCTTLPFHGKESLGLPPCHLSPSQPFLQSSSSSWIRSRRERFLAEEESADEDKDVWFYLSHALGAFLCVITAALAAGLTMGLLSLDPLFLLIKVRAGSTRKEKHQAQALLPIVKQHHLLLVTLLLLNSVANEALPLFLEVMVSPLVAVLLSVSLVLFFGEIIPAAVFTGPNKVDLAYKMVPMVKFVMFLLWPIAFPIAKLLDHVLHGDETSEETSGAFGRGELSALVRIQYEERMAHKKREKDQRRNTWASGPGVVASNTDLQDNVGALDFASTQAIKASKKTVERRASSQIQSNSIRSTTSPISKNDPRQIFKKDNSSSRSDDDDLMMEIDYARRQPSIHLDEVSMVEGALSMKTKMAVDVYTPLHRMVCIPYDLILTEENMFNIYCRGFSRLPVYQRNPDKPNSKASIVGVLLIKQLIVVSPNEQRPLSTLPLARPKCVSPKMNLVDLLNMFQTGRAGHLALVCARPEVGQESVDEGKPIPEAAGLMGIITLEDVLESLLQEQIYDESDKEEREALRLAQWVTQKWKSYVRQRKSLRNPGTDGQLRTMDDVVEEVMTANEGSGLLGSNRNGYQNQPFSPIAGVMQFFDNLRKSE